MQKRQIQSEKQKHKNFILQRACVELLSTREVWRARKRRKKGFLLSRIFPLVHTFILLHEKFLQFDWLRAVVFQLEIPTCENYKTFAGSSINK